MWTCSFPPGVQRSLSCCPAALDPPCRGISHVSHSTVTAPLLGSMPICLLKQCLILATLRTRARTHTHTHTCTPQQAHTVTSTHARTPTPTTTSTRTCTPDGCTHTHAHNAHAHALRQRHRRDRLMTHMRNDSTFLGPNRGHWLGLPSALEVMPGGEHGASTFSSNQLFASVLDLLTSCSI